MEMVNKMDHSDTHNKIKLDDVFRYTDKILSIYGDTSDLSDSERDVGYHISGCSFCYSAAEAYMAFARSVRIAHQVPVEKNLCG